MFALLYNMVARRSQPATDVDQPLYTPLSEKRNEIRLLKLFPLESSSISSISCELRKRELRLRVLEDHMVVLEATSRGETIEAVSFPNDPRYVMRVREV